MNQRALSEVWCTSLGLLKGVPRKLFISGVTVYGGVVVIDIKPPGLMRSPCAQNINDEPSLESVPPLAR